MQSTGLGFMRMNFFKVLFDIIYSILATFFEWLSYHIIHFYINLFVGFLVSKTSKHLKSLKTMNLTLCQTYTLHIKSSYSAFVQRFL